MDWIKLALEIGFEEASMLEIPTLTPKNEVREMCSADKCRVFGKSWSCPPACGSIEECANTIASYSSGILVQSVCKVENAFDSIGIKKAQLLHGKRFGILGRQARLIDFGCLPLSAGPCLRCEICTYPLSPCRYPDKAFPSMEAFGLLVSEVCTKNNVPYYRGENYISFTSCILFTAKEIEA